MVFVFRESFGPNLWCLCIQAYCRSTFDLLILSIFRHVIVRKKGRLGQRGRQNFDLTLVLEIFIFIVLFIELIECIVFEFNFMDARKILPGLKKLDSWLAFSRSMPLCFKQVLMKAFSCGTRFWIIFHSLNMIIVKGRSRDIKYIYSRIS